MSFTRVLGAVAITSLMLAGAALAQSVGGSGSAAAEGAAKATKSETQVNSQADAQATGQVDAQKLEKIREKGAKVSARTRAKAEAKLEVSAAKVNEEAMKNGDAKIASQLASEFGMTAEALLQEKQQLGTTWGELMIAHTLDANSKADVTAQELMQLKMQDCGWGQIAAGLGLKLGEAVSAVRAESQVATGLAKADGKVAVIHGSGAVAGVGAVAGAGAGAKAGGASVGADVKTGVGVKIGN